MNMIQSHIKTFFKVLDLMKRKSEDFPPETLHCYNCDHRHVCWRKGHAGQDSIEDKRLKGFLMARDCPYYVYASRGIKPSSKEPFLRQEEISIFFEILDELKKMKNIPVEFPACSHCVHQEICFKKAYVFWDKIRGKELADFFKAQNCFDYSAAV